MKPRDSMPHTACTWLPCHGSAIASMQRAKPPASASSGVMSRNTTPGLGKSGTARIRDSKEGIANSAAVGPARYRREGRTGRSGRQPPGTIRQLVILARRFGGGLVQRQGGHDIAGLGPDHVRHTHRDGAEQRQLTHAPQQGLALEEYGDLLGFQRVPDQVGVDQVGGFVDDFHWRDPYCLDPEYAPAFLWQRRLQAPAA